MSSEITDFVTMPYALHFLMQKMYMVMYILQYQIIAINSKLPFNAKKKNET